MFSIVIPLYNKELSIKNTINSVLNQTFKDFEIIIVNDGSTDNSVDEVISIKSDKIKLFNKENGGVSSARNLGIKKATKEWICFLDGDDLWENHHLETTYNMIKLFPEEKIFASSFVYSDNRKVNRLLTREEVFRVENYFEVSMKEHLIWTSVLTCNKKCFEFDLFDESLALGEDLYLFAELVKKNKLVKSKLITATYRVDAENRSNVGKYKMNKSFLSKLDFKKMENDIEREYFRALIIQKLKHFIIQKDWQNVIYLIKRYNINLF